MKEELTAGQLNATFSEIFKQSDRAAAVVSGSILEEILERMIVAYLVPHPNVRKNLFDSFSPISTFGAKIDLSFYLGLIDKTEYDDLKLIKNIRNEFAHSIKGINFETQSIKDRCLQLQKFNNSKPPKLVYDNLKTIKTLFQTNTTFLASILYAKTQEIKHLQLYKYNNIQG